jgi:hypothetical protein
LVVLEVKVEVEEFLHDLLEMMMAVELHLFVLLEEEMEEVVVVEPQYAFLVVLKV